MSDERRRQRDTDQPRRRGGSNTILIVAIAVMIVLLALVGIMMVKGTPGRNQASQNTAAASDSASPAPTATSATPADPSASATTAPSTAAPAPACDASTVFSAQLKDNPVDAAKGANFQGTACFGKDQTIWAFNYLEERGGLYVRVGNKAIITKSGSWSWTDTEITSATKTVVFVKANQAQSEWLAGQGPSNEYGNRVVVNPTNIGNAGTIVARVPVAVTVSV